MGRVKDHRAIQQEPKRFSRLLPLGIAFSNGILLWAAFPPIEFHWLGWLVPVPWLWLVRERRFGGGSFWLQLWLGGTISWVILLEGIRRAHPANNLGLLALSLYLGIYCPAFIGVVRAAVYRANVPLPIAAPVVWTALEWLRGRLFTGFSVGLLAHTQSEVTPLIQIADLFGAYGISFLIVFVAACVLQVFPVTGEPRRIAWPLFAMFVIGLTLAYGVMRLQELPSDGYGRPLKVALLQGTRDKVFEVNRELDFRTFEQYKRLMRQAKDEQPDVDLIVWPEATFTSLSPEIFVEGSLIAPPELGIDNQEYTQGVQRASKPFLDRARDAAIAVNEAPSDETFQLLGAETLMFEGNALRNFNSALLLDPQGQIVDRYYKCHAVMFGEYIPFGSIWPWLYTLTPMRQGLSCGDGPRLFEVKGYRISPNICFEITVPHLLRNGYRSLVQRGAAAPDVLINLTDDGWFWGSTVLDLQLACAVFRAVELRRPVLIAANTGISASINSNGRILERGPKRKEHIIHTLVSRDERRSLYGWWGDIPAMLCLAVTAVWLIPRMRETYTSRSIKRHVEQRPYNASGGE